RRHRQEDGHLRAHGGKPRRPRGEAADGMREGAAMSAQPTPAPDMDMIAASWFARRRSGEMSAADVADFELWLAQDAAHREAYDLAERMWSGVEAVRSDPRVIALRERGLSHNTPRIWIVGPALAATAAAAVAGVWVFQSGALSEM